MSLYSGRNMTPFLLRGFGEYDNQSLERKILSEREFLMGENRRVQVYFAVKFLKTLGCSDERAYDVISNVTGVKRRGLTYHYNQHS